MIGLDKILFLFFLTGMNGVACRGVGSCNGVSVGGVGINNGFSSSSGTSTGGGGVGSTADPMGVTKTGRIGRFLFFRLGFGRTRT